MSCHDQIAPPAGSTAERYGARLIALLGLRACWYEAFPFGVQLPRIEPGRVVLPADEPGVAPWSLDLGIELPVRHRGLTIGRYVLVPTSPTTGVGFPPSLRAGAIGLIEPVGSLLAAEMMTADA